MQQDYQLAERQRRQMKREWEDVVLCHKGFKFPRFTGKKRTSLCEITAAGGCGNACCLAERPPTCAGGGGGQHKHMDVA